MRKHPEIGARILAAPSFDDIRAWVLAHHERPDGTGYPHGLTGDEIPLEARILAVADAYEAMTADRVYRRRSARGRARGAARRRRHAVRPAAWSRRSSRALDREHDAGSKPPAASVTK